MSSAAPSAAVGEDELEAFRREWRQETLQRQSAPPPPRSSSHPRPSPRPPPLPSAPNQPRTSLSSDDGLADHLAGVRIDEGEQRSEVEPTVEAKGKSREHDKWERVRPKSALELYTEAVESEREGRLQDALVNYRSAFRLDPDVDRAYHRASLAATHKHAATRAAEPTSSSSAAGVGGTAGAGAGDFRFERTVQLGPDYDAKKEHRSKEEAERESGSGDRDSTHPSSTAYLLNSLLRSIAENPYVRPPPPVSASATPTSPSASPSKAPLELPPPPLSPAHQPPPPVLTPDEALAMLHFIPADEDQPLPLAHLPQEVLLLILRHLVLSSILPPPRSAHVEAEPLEPVRRGKKAPKRRTLREETQLLEMELELEDTDREWRSDVEALERFARVCRAARVVSLDSGLWRALCLRTYVPPQQISREEDAAQLVRQHGNDWRRFFIEHPRIRLDGCYISVVTYLRRGETQSAYAPTHLITFYRYLRFYHHGLVLSLLTTDPPKHVVRRLNPALRVKGLNVGRWRLRGETVELWGLEDPGVAEASRKYSFRMTCRFKSTARGRMNKLDMLSLATENRLTLEVEDVPIRPTKPFYFSKVAAYAGEERAEPAAGT